MILDPKNFIEQSRGWMDQWLFSKKIHHIFTKLNFTDKDAFESVELIKILIVNQDFYTEFSKSFDNKELTELILKDTDTADFLKLNHYDDILWFNKEAFEALVHWLFNLSFIQIFFYQRKNIKNLQKSLENLYSYTSSLLKAMDKSEYQIPKLLKLLDNKDSKSNKSKGSKSKNKKKNK